MSATDVATLAVAGVVIVTAIGSILLLSYRIGRLTGTTEARISYGENDRTHIWEKLGALGSKLDRHIETHGR